MPEQDSSIIVLEKPEILCMPGVPARFHITKVEGQHAYAAVEGSTFPADAYATGGRFRHLTVNNEEDPHEIAQAHLMAKNHILESARLNYLPMAIAPVVDLAVDQSILALSDNPLMTSTKSRVTPAELAEVRSFAHLHFAHNSNPHRHQINHAPSFSLGWLCTDKRTHELVGTIGVWEERLDGVRVCEWAPSLTWLRVFPQHQGSGYSSEMVWRITRYRGQYSALAAHVKVGNERSARALTSNGFEEVAGSARPLWDNDLYAEYIRQPG